MKMGIYKLLAATAAMTLGSQAMAAATDSQQAQFIASAHNPPKCLMTSSQATVQLGDDVISGSDGLAKTDVGVQVAQALNGANIHAWCTGNANVLKVARTSMSLNGDGAGAIEGFSQAVIYDVQLTVTGVSQRNGLPAYATTTIGDNGVGSIVGGLTALKRFGATGDGPQVTFKNDVLASRSYAVTNAEAGYRSRLAYSTTTTHRLVAGAYQSTVKLTLAPGNI